MSAVALRASFSFEGRYIAETRQNLQQTKPQALSALELFYACHKRKSKMEIAALIRALTQESANLSDARFWALCILSFLCIATSLIETILMIKMD